MEPRSEEPGDDLGGATVVGAAAAFGDEELLLRRCRGRALASCESGSGGSRGFRLIGRNTEGSKASIIPRSAPYWKANAART